MRVSCEQGNCGEIRFCVNRHRCTEGTGPSNEGCREIYNKRGFMSILEQIEQRASALKVNELAEILRVTPQHLYRLASDGLIPCFRIAGAIRFDPHDVGEWLRSRQPKMVRSRHLRVA